MMMIKIRTEHKTCKYLNFLLQVINNLRLVILRFMSTRDYYAYNFAT